jgi:hypothetical protein
MKRLCFLSPDVAHARNVVRDLRAAGIADKHIYVIARTGTELEDLPDGGPDDDDFLPAFERGVALGGATGAFLGLLAIAFPPTGLIIGGGAVLLIGAMGASVGGLLTGMAGASYHSSRLEAFESDLRQGKVLVMVDVAVDRITHVNELIKRQDPEVEIEGLEPPAPIIP